MSGVKWIEAEGFLVVILPKKPPKTIKSSSPIYKDVKAAVAKNDVPRLLDVLFPEDAVSVKSSGKVKMDAKGSITMAGKEVDSALGRMVKEFTEEGLHFDPLLNLQKNIDKNPNEWIRQQLFRFLERNKVALTDDGCFVCYKGVEEKEGHLVDCHTKTFCNDIGRDVSMPRNKVDQNPHQTCSTGLHVAAHDYVKNVYSNKIYIVVKINPKDVCSVPYDYNDQKMRVCHYKVIAMMGNEKQMGHVYYPWDKTRMKKKAIRESQKRVWVDISKTPASLIIECVLSLTGKIIPISPKSKGRVVKYALKFLQESGYKVEDPSRVEIPLGVLTEKAKKGVSIKGMSGSEIIAFVFKTTGRMITISAKSKARVVDYAVKMLAEQGYETETDAD